MSKTFGRRIFPFAFFLALLTWISLKVAYSFSSEFPALSLLCKWDCGWYESIARQGYRSPIPPLHQNSELSNVAFFPAYPLLGRFVSTFGIPLPWALPLASILCSILVSIALARHWKGELSGSTGVRFAILLAYPASFYLFVAYSEALYLAAMLGGSALLLSHAQNSYNPNPSKQIALPLFGIGLAGFVLGGTRLTGFVIPAFLLLGTLIFTFRPARTLSPLRDPGLARALLFFGAAIASIGAFFAFTHIRFGVWNLYFEQLRIGWYKEFNPAKAFGLLLNPPFPPTLKTSVLFAETRHLSWMIIVSILIIGGYAGIRAFMSAIQAFRFGDRVLFLRTFLVFGALAHFFIVVCGDVGPWDAWGNGLRYSMPTVYLLAIAWRDEWTPLWMRKHPFFGWLVGCLFATALACLFRFELHYLERFIRLKWVS